jgi:uncharacterized membrane protein YfhO
LNSELKQKVILEDAAGLCSDAVYEQQDFAKSEVDIVSYRSDEVIIHANAASDGFLVLTDMYYPGWKVYVDGQEKSIFKANYLFRALNLKSGSHQIRFVYSPKSFSFGLVSFLISFAAIGLFVLFKRS